MIPRTGKLMKHIEYLDQAGSIKKQCSSQICPDKMEAGDALSPD